ncbi:MAG: PAS domain S-box protein [Candidatus Neomarinimicrobiota bacterium]
MKDQQKTKNQLIKELEELRERVAELELAGPKESEERFRTSVENMLDCFGIYTAIRDESGVIVDFRIDFINAAACGSNRMTREEQIGKGLCELLPAHRETGLFDEYCHVVDSGRPLEKETLEYEDAYGKKSLSRAFDIRASKLGDGFVAAWRDITERKQLTEDLRLSEERYKSLYNSSKEAIGWADIDGTLLDVNDSFCTLTGYSREELLTGKKYQDLTPEEYHDYEAKMVGSMIRTGEPVEYEKEYIKKDGSRVPILLTVFAALGKTGLPIGVAAIVRDISEQKESEHDLRQSEEKYRQLVSTSTDAIILVDAETKSFIEVNKACEKLYGYSQEEFRHMTVRDTSAEPEKSDAAIKDMIDGRLKRIPVRYHKKKDGTIFPLEISTSTFMMGDRRVLCGIARDISEQLKAREELERRRRDLRRLTIRLVTAQEEERKRVSMELHDEFGQALTAAQINLASIKTELPPGSPSDLLEKLEETSSLTDELPERSRELSLELRPTLLDDLGLAPTIRWYTDRFTKRLNVNVEVNVGDFEERLPGEIETVIYRVMQEAMTNISRHAEARNVRIDLKRKKSSVMMLVEDDGKGFVVQAVVDRETPEGRLGLIGMEERVGYLGGSLDIRSTPGKGTTIRVEMPMEEVV